jgi:hypothetical protein
MMPAEQGARVLPIARRAHPPTDMLVSLMNVSLQIGGN